MPVVAFTVAIAALDELHVPPGVLLVKAMANPVHTAVDPAIGGTAGLTVTVAMELQPE
jgi:hypothetical protein